jgi:hypothetical protein
MVSPTVVAAMFRPAPVLTALALLAASGLAHGLVTSRWQRSEALDAALARVPLVPREVGGWHAYDLESDPEVFAQARADAYWVRRYEDPSRQASVTVILMCGRSGPLAVHTPDVCYRGTGYDMVGSAEQVEVPLPGAGAARLWTARFRKEQPTGGAELRLFWGWSADGAWLAPSAPRLTFAGRPALYKLYVIDEVPPGGGRAGGDQAVGFLPRLLPALSRALFEGASG